LNHGILSRRYLGCWICLTSEGPLYKGSGNQFVHDLIVWSRALARKAVIYNPSNDRIFFFSQSVSDGTHLGTIETWFQGSERGAGYGVGNVERSW